MPHENKMAEDKQELIKELRQMMKDNENLKNLRSDDTYLERYLNATDFDVQAAFERVTSFYETLAENPDWFTKSKPTEKKDIIDKDIRIVLHKKDKEGRPIYIVKIGNMDPSSMELIDDIIPIDDFFIEGLFLMDSGIENGLCVIIDISNFSLKQLKWMTPHNIKIALKRILSMPIKEFRYHVINSSMTVHMGIKILWPFLPQQIKDAVKFHFSDFDSLYQYIDKEVLPEEYGGNIQFDYSKQHSIILDKDEEIFENFRLNRLMYLETANFNKKESDD